MSNPDNGIHPEANKVLDQLLDIFGGADGGVGFARLRIFLDDMARRADAGDEHAQQIMLVTHRFYRLVNIGSGKKELSQP